MNQHCPYYKRMKALQTFNGVYSGLLTTILFTENKYPFLTKFANLTAHSQYRVDTGQSYTKNMCTKISIFSLFTRENKILRIIGAIVFPR